MSIPQAGGEVIENYDQMVAFLASGCKREDQWRIGTEHEKFGFHKKNLTPLPYDGPCSILAILRGLRDRFNWEPVMESHHLIGLTRDCANVSLEPGGQLELSGAPLKTLHETAAELEQHLTELKEVSDEIGANFINLGAAPIWPHEAMPTMPKGRYRLMTDYMDQVGTMGKSMMYRTSCVQVNLDFSSENDMVKKMRVALALQPIATALFANSPFFDSKLSGYKSWRSRIWWDLDASRTGMLPFVFEPGFGFEAWVDYALDVPMYFVHREGVYIDALGQSFRDFLNGKLPALPGEKPRLSDWQDHLTTIFPEARLKQFIEMRGADAGDKYHITALSAFWVGILYNKTALDSARELTKHWTTDFRKALLVNCAKDGLNAKVNGISIFEVASELVQLARDGLIAREYGNAQGTVENEVYFLEPLFQNIKNKQSSADRLIKLYESSWKLNLNEVYRHASFYQN